MKFTVEADWLRDNLAEKDVRVIDCRFELARPVAGRKQFEAGHIPGSVYFDLEKDMSAPVKQHGGRHPLPDLDVLKEKLEKAGIGNNTTVVAYDSGEGAFAGRLWWLISYMGHENVYILNGGMKAWLEQDYPITTERPAYEETSFNYKVNSAVAASYEEVEAIVQANNNGVVLIDSREYKRFTGEVEPIDKKSGHIPGAINKVWTNGLVNGRFKDAEEQKERFSELDPNKQYIVYCGSGVTATPNFLALKAAGFQNVKLYPGSFSDWISYDDNKVCTIKE